jgi:hypothetical protein
VCAGNNLTFQNTEFNLSPDMPRRFVFCGFTWKSFFAWLEDLQITSLTRFCFSDDALLRVRNFLAYFLAPLQQAKPFYNSSFVFCHVQRCALCKDLSLQVIKEDYLLVHEIPLMVLMYAVCFAGISCRKEGVKK